MRWPIEKSNIMIKRITDEISRCLSNDCHLAALALALTLPDICGKAEFPGEGSSKKRYIDWYEDHIGRYQREMSKSEKEDLADLPYMSGELVYQLRCSFLHAGDTDVDRSQIHEEQNQLTAFNLELRRHDDVLAAGASTYLNYAKDGGVEFRRYDIGVTYLCKILSNVALKYYENNKVKFDFFSYNIIDLTQKPQESDEEE